MDGRIKGWTDTREDGWTGQADTVTSSLCVWSDVKEEVVLMHVWREACTQVGILQVVGDLELNTSVYRRVLWFQS